MKRSVKLVFMRSNLIGSKFIRFMTWSQYSHVGVLLPDGNVVEARYPEGVIMRRLDLAVEHATDYEIVKIPVKNPKAVYDFMKDHLGKKYDLSGLFAFLTKRDWQNLDKWFCSELVASALKAGGCPVAREDASRVTPDDIFNYPEAESIPKV